MVTTTCSQRQLEALAKTATYLSAYQPAAISRAYNAFETATKFGLEDAEAINSKLRKQ